MSLKYALFIAILLLAPKVYSSKCPDWIKNRLSEKLPLCPSENTPVPESYPVGAVVISDDGFMGRDSNFTTEVVEKVLLGAGEKTPLIILPISPSTHDHLTQRINSMDLSEEQKQKFLNSMLYIPSNGYTWQQDYMQPYVDSKTGVVKLSQVSGYNRQGKNFENIIEAVSDCGFERGPLLEDDNSKTGKRPAGGAFGGNIEGLPGGLCLLGDDSFKNHQSWQNYAHQACGKNHKNQIKVPTWWLDVGHSDEIIRVVRNKNQQSPCDFSIAIASPKKAMELLKANPKDIFTDFKKRGYEPIEQLINRRVNRNFGLYQICKITDYARKQKEEPPPPKIKSKSKSISQLFEYITIFSKAKANSDAAEISLNCTDITNAEAYEIFVEDDYLGIYNDLIQVEMDKLKADVLKKYKSIYPKCNIDIIDVPNLFYGGFPVEKKGGGYELPQKSGASFLPNPTNGISINDTYISPDPANASFRKYLEEEYKKRGLKSEFIDTFDYAHLGSGNLHCVSNTIHLCKPEGKK